MIERLDELTMKQFIDMNCGKLDVLGSGSPFELAVKREQLLVEYRAIVDNPGLMAMVTSHEFEIKAKGRVVLYKICRNLIDIKAYDEVRSILDIYGIHGEDNEKIGTQISSLLKRSEFEYKRILEHKDTEIAEPISEKSIRDGYAAEIASIMAYYKMPLDINNVSASVYAHLVAQANMEIRRKTEALNH